ncbi:hypothetical protein DFH28DRAFT_903636 [Melampsora americana]|nr:hypothetical protein DFH28DRAFT_903636 [Melampsora americana]
MPEANGIRASLICDGSPLTEYPHPSSAPYTVFCESTTDKTFQVQLSGPETTSDLIIELWCDGVNMKSYAFPQNLSLELTFHGLYLPNDGTKLLPFKFSNIELCEEEDSHPDQIVKNLGTVSVQLFRCKFGSLRPKSVTSLPTVASTNKFSERNKKTSMIPHTISLGESTTAPRPRSTMTRETRQVDPKPYLQFVWHYRSRNMLISAGVIPPPVSPLLHFQRPTPTITHQKKQARPIQVPKPRVEEWISIDEGVSGPSSNTTHPNIKSGVTPLASGGKPVVIDLCNDNAASTFFSSSIENPILIDNDEDVEHTVQSENLPQPSSSSSRQLKIKPVKIESERAGNGQPSQTKRVHSETQVEENNQKRFKSERISLALYDSDATLEGDNSV